MGILMLVGIAASNSILIVEFAHRLHSRGEAVGDAIIGSCRVRLRPILMTSLATIIGMFPMALKMGTGSEQYAPLARAIIGGLTAPVILTMYIVPAAYLLGLWKKENESCPGRSRTGFLVCSFLSRSSAASSAQSTAYADAAAGRSDGY